MRSKLEIMELTSIVLIAFLGMLLSSCRPPLQPPSDGSPSNEGTTEAHPVIVVRHNANLVQPHDLVDINPTKLGVDKDVEFVIENVGGDDLKLRRVPPVALIGSDASMFSVFVQPTAQIGPGGSTRFVVRFTPSDMRSRSIGVSIGSNDPEQASYDFVISRYTEAEISLKRGGTEVASGATYDMGTVQLPFSKPMSFSIQNVGTGDLELTANPKVVVSGTDADQFSVSGDPATPIAPGTSSDFTLTFKPTIRGSKTAEVRVESNDADEGVYSFTVVGLGILGDMRVTNAQRESDHPSLVWTGTEYGVAWQDGRDENYEIYFTRLNAVGKNLVQDVRITNDAAHSRWPSLVWTGREYGVAWVDDRGGTTGVYFARISSSGVKLGEDVLVANANTSGRPSITWNGTEYGVAWHDEIYDPYDPINSEIYFARVSSSGTMQGDAVPISQTPQNSISPSLVWTGTEYGIAWMDGPYNGWDIYFTRISSSGVKQGEAVRIADSLGSAKAPSLVWSGNEYGVAWSEGGYEQHEIYFARLSASGVKLGSTVRISNNTWDSRDPSLIWTGTEYGVAWEDGRGVYTYRDVYFARISASGAKQGDNVRVTTQEDSWVPSLAWAESEYGVAWRDSGSSEIFLALLDRDGMKQ